VMKSAMNGQKGITVLPCLRTSSRAARASSVPTPRPLICVVNLRMQECHAAVLEYPVHRAAREFSVDKDLVTTLSLVVSDLKVPSLGHRHGASGCLARTSQVRRSIAELLCRSVLRRHRTRPSSS
jgi:hypothetical protein